ncbi:hypothetical protein Scep_012527 [Stephania cephalantha]|uniref:Uncharacterized protein n=1 Tax=Stephania cephalantha TaxID=152367 RepID=A0AAP0P7L5_9MAGN
MPRAELERGLKGLTTCHTSRHPISRQQPLETLPYFSEESKFINQFRERLHLLSETKQKLEEKVSMVLRILTSRPPHTNPVTRGVALIWRHKRREQEVVLMERLSQAGRLIANIRIGIYHFFQAMFVVARPH